MNNANETVTVNAARFAKLEAMEAKQKLSARKATVKTLLYAKKAREAGITVSKAEVDAHIAAEDARKAAEATPVA